MFNRALPWIWIQLIYLVNNIYVSITPLFLSIQSKNSSLWSPFSTGKYSILHGVYSLFYSEYKGSEAKNMLESNIQENVSSTLRRSQVSLQCTTAPKCTVIYDTLIDHLPRDCLSLSGSITPVQATSVGPDKADGVLRNMSPLNSLVTQNSFLFSPKHCPWAFQLKSNRTLTALQ